MRIWIWSVSIVQWFCGFLGVALAGCSTAKNEMSAGSIRAVNHVDGTAINWFKVNGYRASGGGGDQCCIVMPDKWRPGLMASIEWEVDPDRWADLPSFSDPNYQSAYAKHKANYQKYKTTVEIPEWPGIERCGLTVHFLTCQQIKVTTSCWMGNAPQYPIKESRHMKEPAVCTK
jgi:hypothetical protein